MKIGQVVEWVEIEAPREEVFGVIANCDRRLQLSPLWGVGQIEKISEDFPKEGSSYHTRLKAGDETEFESVVTTFDPPRKFAYRLIISRDTRVSWIFLNGSQGTRLGYQEEFHLKEGEGDEFVESVHGVVRQWLENVKNYAELRQGRTKRFVRWLLDRYLLKMPPEQRRIIGMVLVMQAASFVAFVGAALFLAIAAQ